MIIFLYGPDTYRSKEKLKEIEKKFIQEVDKAGLNIIKIEGENLTANKFRETVLTPGFLARRRLIIIENICLNKNVQLQSIVRQFLEKQEDKTENIVVFWENTQINMRIFANRYANKLFNRLKQEKYAQEFNLLKGYKLNEWIKKQVADKKGKIENSANNLLADYVGSNLWQMNNEIDKLISYKQNKIIFSDDVNLLVKSKIDENIFNLVDALGTKNKKKALKLLNDQIENKTPWAYLMAMIIRQFRILLQVKSDAGGVILRAKPEGSRLNLGLHPYVLQKAKIQARNFSLEELKNIYQRLLEIDVKLKTSQIDPRVLFDLFIYSTASMRPV